MDTNWHRLFGLVLTDLLAGTPFEVELEKDLAIRQQFLDVVVVRRGSGSVDAVLPDGLGDLTDHNLITFKSFREALDDWALKELTGHYVNYRKQLADRDQPLVPEDRFRLIAVCARFPEGLAAVAPLTELSPGVYDCRRGSDAIRIVVTRQLPNAPVNDPLRMFSAVIEQARAAAERYRLRSSETGQLVCRLLRMYRREGVAMPYSMADFQREFREEMLAELTPEERAKVLADLTSEERAKVFADLTSEERAKVLADLTSEERAKVLAVSPLEERLAGLPPEQVEEWLKRMKASKPAAPPE